MAKRAASEKTSAPPSAEDIPDLMPGHDDTPPDPGAAKVAAQVGLLDAEDEETEGDAPEPETGAPMDATEPERIQRARKAAKRAGRRGGRKLTKEELEAELKELRRRNRDLEASIPKPEQEQAATLSSMQRALEGSIGIAGSYLAVRFGPHWEITEQERAQLGAVWTPLLAPYLAGMEQAIPWILACGVTWQIFEPKWKAHKALVIEAPARPGEDQDQPAIELVQ